MKTGNLRITPLHHAAIEGLLAMVQILLHNNATIDIRNKNKESPLMLAVFSNHSAIVQNLLEHNSDVNLKGGKGDNTPVNIAAMKGFLDIIKILLQNNANINILNKNKEMSLHIAISNKHSDVAKYLIEHNADLNVNRGSLERTPLLYAVAYGMLDIIKMILQYNARFNSLENKNRLLECAIENNQSYVVKYLIENNADVNKTVSGMTPLHHAALYGLLDIVKILLQNNASIDSLDPVKRTPLHYAMRSNYPHVVKYLIEHCADVNKGEESRSDKLPLHYAAMAGMLGIVRILLQNNVSINRLVKGKTPLHYAIQNNHLDVIKYLIEHNADLNLKGRRKGRRKQNRTPFQQAVTLGILDIVKIFLQKNISTNSVYDGIYYAIKNNRSDIAKYLIEHNADLGFKLAEKDNMKYLHVAAENGLMEIVEILLQNNFSINSLDKKKMIPLFYAINNKHSDVAKYLIENKSDLNLKRGKYKQQSLHLAASAGLLEIVKILLKNNVSIDSLDKYKMTPLLNAVKNKHSDVAKCLIEHNADLNIKGGMYHQKPLHYAASAGMLDIVIILLQNNASVDSLDIFDNEPLHYALKSKHSDVAKFLIEHHADLNLKHDNNKHTHLHYAARYGFFDIVKLLLHNNVNINSLDKHKFTPLLYAIKNKHLCIAKYLIEHNADVDLQTRENKTSLHYAVNNGWLDVVEILLQNNVSINSLDSSNTSPLQYAYGLGRKHSDVAIIKCLIEHSANLNFKNIYGRAPIHVSARKKRFLDVVQLLLEKNVSINSLDKYNFTPVTTCNRIQHFKCC